MDVAEPRVAWMWPGRVVAEPRFALTRPGRRSVTEINSPTGSRFTVLGRGGARSGRDGRAEQLAADDERGDDCQGENAQNRDDAAEDDAPPPAPLDLVEQGVLLAFAHALPAAQCREGAFGLFHAPAV